MENKQNKKRNEYITQEWNTLGGHDPTIIKDDHSKNYYMFSTDSVLDGQYTSGIQVRASSDLIHWEYKGTVFNEVPERARKWSNAEGLWAPEIVKFEKEYRMYYSASTFGSTTSCICLATSESLEGPWRDQGIVVKTNSSIAEHNAIDANIITDKENRMWLCYGSFFGGIYLLELNKTTGFPVQKNFHGKCIAKRDISVERAIEGPFIVYNPTFDYYYLFSSYDSLFDTYNIRLARAKEIEGPYMDIGGRSMLTEKVHPNKIGTKILGSYNFKNGEKWIAPGHNSIFTDNGLYYMIHHVRYNSEEGIESLTFIRRLRWLENGWPVVSVEYLSEVEKVDEKNLCKKDLVGFWEIIEFNEQENQMTASQKLEVTEENLEKITRINQDYYFSPSDMYFQVYRGYDWENKSTGIYLSGLSGKGRAILGKRVE